MGIPSYFRRILQKFPACVKSTLKTPELLCFDFNCLIYRCLRSPTLPPFTEETQEQWETSLCEEVCRTVKEVWAEAGRPKSVYLAVDGVVPMAKIRQQRVRRFKSVWLQSRVGGGASGGDVWDKNAITPGTAFMDKLGSVLEELCRRQGRGWSVSGVREPGEGEHKILARVRGLESASCPKSIVIYGLDADLVILSMILKYQKGIENLYLLREKQEFGGKLTLTAEGRQEYQSLDISIFSQALGIQSLHDCMRYVGLMNLMGNDFLPHSVSYSLGEDGHDHVLKEYRRGTALVRENTEGHWILDIDILQKVATQWATDEEDRIAHFIRKKREQALRGPGKGMDASEAWPLEWAVERELMPEGDGQTIVEGWKDLVWNQFIGGSKEESVRNYCQGFQWILDYYTGQKEVSMEWMYGSWLPPFWSDIAGLCKRVYGGAGGPALDRSVASPVTPEEQLAMVLPLESWGLIQKKEYSRVPILAPQFWPIEFGFCSFGRLWLWQCEALVPVLTAERLRRILAASA